MDDAGVKIVREALETQLKDEDFSRAVGRTVRRNEMDFKRYIEIIGEVRDMALSESITLEEAAKRIVTRD